MKYIDDEKLLERLLIQEGIIEHFETSGLDFRLVEYEKGELICAPGRPLEDILFTVRGTVQVYGLREDGKWLPVSQGMGRTAMGAIEFVQPGLPVFYTEAVEDLLCVSLPIERNREALERDCVFLMYLLKCINSMVVTYTLIGHREHSVEERVLTFLRDVQPDHTLHSINQGLLQFHCSRRQLQRVVKRLCDEGKLKKLKKGVYVLEEGQG